MKGETGQEGYPLDGRPAWAEIDLSAFAHNMRALRQATQPGARFIAVIKADGYGHGALPLARVAVREGADGAAVAILDEALLLRNAGIKLPILILGYTPFAASALVVANDLSQSVFSLSAAEALSQAAIQLGKKAKVHLKVETGMGRIGFCGEQGMRDMIAAARLPGILIEGIFSHFATADEADKTFACRQLERFAGTIDWLKKRGLEIPMRHIANSAAILDFPESHLDGVRAGIALYGSYPSDEVAKGKAGLRPVMTLKARVVQIKEVAAQTPVSYGCTYRCPGPTRLATVPLGYADGVPRILSGKIVAHAKGQTIPQVGRVCMDQMVFDIGELPLIEGDEIVLFGRWQENGVLREVPVETWAKPADTISYEIFTGISPRVPRFYK